MLRRTERTSPRTEGRGREGRCHSPRLLPAMRGHDVVQRLAHALGHGQRGSVRGHGPRQTTTPAGRDAQHQLRELRELRGGGRTAAWPPPRPPPRPTPRRIAALCCSDKIDDLDEA